MQHNRINMLSSSETCHLGSSPNNSAMDQQNLLPSNPAADEQNLLPSTLESENFPHYLLDSQMPHGPENTSFSLWDSAGSSSMGCLVDRDSLFQPKREHFVPALSIGGPLTIEGRRREGSSSSLPSHNLNIDLNLNQADQFDTENVDMVESAGHSGVNAFALNRNLSTTSHVLHHEISENVLRREVSSNAIGSSSQTANLFDGAASREAGVFVGHRSSYKRKSIDGSLAESSANGSSRNHQQNNYGPLSSPSTHEITTSLTMPTSTNYAISSPPAEQLNQNPTSAANASLSGHFPLSSHPHESEMFPRNTRMRIGRNEYDESLPSLLPEGSFRCSSYQSRQQQSSFVPVQPRVTRSSASSHDQPHVPAVTHFSQSLHQPPSNGNSGSRIGSSSSSADTMDQRSGSQNRGRSLMRNNLPEPLSLASSLFSTDSASSVSAPRSGSDQQNVSSSSIIRAAANVEPQHVSGFNASQPNSSARGSAEMARRSLLAARLSHLRSQSIALQHRGHSSSTHEIHSDQPGPSSRGIQQHYSRVGAPSIDRQNSSYVDLQSFMQSIADSREGTRTVSELRNMVDQIRQGRSAARLEDLLADRSLIVRRGLIDRHREMRLDVDNMSYEELLALGERIGHVSTGLTEEKIMSNLKHWNFVDIPLEDPPTVVEPCCICQENYADGEDMGRLDCGHDFHTACIKQWLVIKNTCPICKKTALGT